MLMAAKAELGDLRHEQQREMEGLLDSVRSLTRELKLQETIIDAFIPRHYQVLSASPSTSFIPGIIRGVVAGDDRPLRALE